MVSGPREPVPASGVYALVLRLRRGRRIEIGSLGSVWFPAGDYLYAGSGRRVLASRLERHTRRVKALRWHIDHFRLHARLIGIAVVPWARGREFAVARALREHSACPWIVRGFGSSDCRCPTHLVYLGTEAMPMKSGKRSPGSRWIMRSPGRPAAR